MLAMEFTGRPYGRAAVKAKGIPIMKGQALLVDAFVSAA
jgi:hypothetical protein